MRVRIAGLVALLALVYGCGSTTPSPSAPTRTGSPSSGTPAATPLTPATLAARTPAVPRPTENPTEQPQPDATALPSLRKSIDLEAVNASGAGSCKGDYFGGTRSRSYSHDLWTIRCGASIDAPAMLDNIKMQLEATGVLVTDTGNNLSPNGDGQYDLNFEAAGLIGSARLVVLDVGNSQVVVFTIDQTPS